MRYGEPWRFEEAHGALWICVLCEECKGSRHRTGMLGHAECLACDGMGELCFPADDHLEDFASAGLIHAKA